MVSWTRRAAIVAAVLVALLALTPLRVARADDPVKLRVEITDSGFAYNGKEGDPVIEVEQGKLVEMTFVWAHKGYIHDEHIIVLEGYKLESDKLTSEHKEFTFKFLADKPGTFRFKCDLDCEIHDFMQRGALNVRRGGGGGGAAALTPTKLNVSPSSWVTGGETVALMASLNDGSGNPVPKAEVRFLLDAEFAGRKGKMDIGSAKTDAKGVAFLDFKPTLATNQYAITARFEGMGVYAESEQAIAIQSTGAPPSAYVMESTGLGIIPPWAASLTVGVADRPLIHQLLDHWATSGLALVVLAVWGIFGFILYQAFSISRVHGRR
ncbi:MAG: hypothetical protein Q7T26_04300 [Dehalococcoidia bacterium]|nr:hypothetical protein [Dehalococcoidia bacterium]